jgi:hypothetical protein
VGPTPGTPRNNSSRSLHSGETTELVGELAVALQQTLLKPTDMRENLFVQHARYATQAIAFSSDHPDYFAPACNQRFEFSLLYRR